MLRSPRLPDSTSHAELNLYSKVLARAGESAVPFEHMVGPDSGWDDSVEVYGEIPGNNTRTFQYLGSREDRGAKEKMRKDQREKERRNEWGTVTKKSKVNCLGHSIGKLN